MFAGARGPHIFKDWKKHIKKAIFLTPEVRLYKLNPVDTHSLKVYA